MDCVNFRNSELLNSPREVTVIKISSPLNRGKLSIIMSRSLSSLMYKKRTPFLKSVARNTGNKPLEGILLAICGCNGLLLDSLFIDSQML